MENCYLYTFDRWFDAQYACCLKIEHMTKNNAQILVP